MRIYTIGHSTHSEEEFLTLLNTFKIKKVIDVRSFPGSRYVPIFNKEVMEVWLKDHQIDYLHLSELGGLRKLDKNVNPILVDGWRNASFRNYAAYSLSKDYHDGIEELLRLSHKEQVVIMCSEAVPWRCHRLIISNTLVDQGIEVEHIMSNDKLIKHKLGMYGAKAIKKDNEITYPKEEKSEEDSKE